MAGIFPDYFFDPRLLGQQGGLFGGLGYAQDPFAQRFAGYEPERPQIDTFAQRFGLPTDYTAPPGMGDIQVGKRNGQPALMQPQGMFPDPLSGPRYRDSAAAELPPEAMPTAGPVGQPGYRQPNVGTNNIGTGGGSVMPAAGGAVSAGPGAAGAPDFGTRLMAGLGGFAQSGALLPALGNLVGGLVTGRRQDPQGYAQEQQTQSQAAIYDAVLKATGDPNTAAAMAQSQETFKALAPDIFGPPKVVKTGTDSMGREIYKVQKGSKFYDIPGGGQPTTSIDNPRGLSGEDYLKTIETPIANTVRSILEGRMAPPTSFAASKPYWQTILQHAANAEPGFDLVKWQGRVTAAKDFSSGQAARNITSLNTVIGHLGDLMTKSDNLGNTFFTPLNDVKNWAMTKLGQPAPREFNLARDAVANEMAKVFRTTGMSETDIREWKKTIDSSSSPEQFRAVISTGIDLMHSRIDALKDQYQRGMGKEPPEFLTGRSLKTLDNLKNWAMGGTATPATSAAPSPEAIQFLRANPNTLQQFEQKYGKGAAQKYLNMKQPTTPPILQPNVT